MPILTCTPAKPPRVKQLVVQVIFKGTLINQENGRAVACWEDPTTRQQYLITETNNVYKVPNTAEPWGINAKLIDDGQRQPPRVH